MRYRLISVRDTSMNDEKQAHVYIRSDTNLWTVGFYSPDGKWNPESDHESIESAAERVSFLNGAINQEKQIAQAILDAQKIHKESYKPGKMLYGLPVEIGKYSKSKEECFIAACKNNDLSPNLWYLLELANHWHNDIQA